MAWHTEVMTELFETDEVREAKANWKMAETEYSAALTVRASPCASPCAGPWASRVASIFVFL